MMKIVEQSITFEEEIDGEAIIRKLEKAARTCYKSEGAVPQGGVSGGKLIRSIVTRGHHSVLEHVSISARVITNRGISHEWVRHRVGWSYSQESTRYCNYGGEKFGNEITVIWPWFLGDRSTIFKEEDSVVSSGSKAGVWLEAMKYAEYAYRTLLSTGCKPEEARGVLPNDLKTEFVATANLRAWRNFFEVRCGKAAHPQIRELALQALAILSTKIPVVFGDLSQRFSEI